MMTDKEFVNKLKEIVLRVGGENEQIRNRMWRRETDRRQRSSNKFTAAFNSRLDAIKNQVKGAKFALIEIQADDKTGILYRGRPCKIIEVGDNEDELRDIEWHPYLHKEYRDSYSDSSCLRTVPVRLLKGI